MSARAFHQFFVRASAGMLRRLLADRTGGVAIMVALLSPVLVGFVGLGAESGYWYLTQRMTQNAADTAAHGAGRSLLAGGGSGGMQAMADYLVTEAGVSAQDRTVVPHNPPTSGAYAGDDAAVEVIVTKALPRMFTGIYTQEPVQIGARAVSLTYPGATGCVLALSETAEGAITVSGSSDASVAVCDLASNAAGPSSFMMSGNSATISANCINTVGGAVTTGNLSVNCPHLREYAPRIEDPFADVAEPAPTPPCDHTATVGSNNTSTTVTAAYAHESGMLAHRYCSGLDLRGTVTFSPGLYMIEGGSFLINSNAQVAGDGVVFYLAPGVDLRFSGTAMLDVSPPLSGPYAGMVIFGSRASTGVSHTINGNMGSILDGAIYAPSSHLTMSGNAGTSSTGCTQFVTNTITFSGSGAIDIHCNNPPERSVVIPDWVELVE